MRSEGVTDQAGHWPKKGKPRGRPFAVGYDPRRHQLTRAERQKGYLMATRFVRMPARCRAWLRKKIKWHYLTSEQREALIALHGKETKNALLSAS